MTTLAFALIVAIAGLLFLALVGTVRRIHRIARVSR